MSLKDRKLTDVFPTPQDGVIAHERYLLAQTIKKYPLGTASWVGDIVDLTLAPFRDTEKLLSAARKCYNGRIARRKRSGGEPKLDVLGSLIWEILIEHPTAHWTEVLSRLEGYVHYGVIQSMKDGVIEWEDENYKIQDTSFYAIKPASTEPKRFWYA